MSWDEVEVTLPCVWDLRVNGGGADSMRITFTIDFEELELIYLKLKEEKDER